MSVFVDSNNWVSEQDGVRWALWALGDSRGWRPGSFFERLIEAYGHADHENQDVLRQAYPRLFLMLEKGRQRGGVEVLAALIGEAK
ncbi:hypothetical protein [Psychromicrobium lacuslunae]|uniref:Uncharacterized protein n=1 Tax=Psychromicrobium lacuslunae TaxID=1618207 RepID=A0A0D4C1F5_9MICC|nr:hypothetical protein [Psychromicrobium lacuslunae]AJT42394.1 hypothetical protein UM93_14435 [Psychromicrobium lacuslunae]